MSGVDTEGSGSMKRIAEFEFVTEVQFYKDAEEYPGIEAEEIPKGYHSLRKPKRATAGSAGYDFYAPFPIRLEPGETVKVPTGIRCRMDEDWVLAVFPRSGLGFKYRLQLNNTVGIIDSDYYNALNEGHIQIKLCNDSKEGKTLELQAGEAFAQGIFLQYGITSDDDADGERTGGFGSTSGH